MPHTNPDTQTLDQKLLGLAAKWRFDDSVMNDHIEAQNAEAIYAYACELVHSENATINDRCRARHLEERMTSWRRVSGKSDPKERIARHNARMAGTYLNPTLFRE